MKKLTDEEVRKSFKIWLTNFSENEDATALGPFLHDRIKAFVPHQQGWLKKARKGSFLSAATVAEQLKNMQVRPDLCLGLPVLNSQLKTH